MGKIKNDMQLQVDRKLDTLGASLNEAEENRQLEECLKANVIVYNVLGGMPQSKRYCV
jgi:hypothetical protein